MSQNVLTNATPKVKAQVSPLERLKDLVLAMQHLIAMFGATVLVPILTGFDSSVALFSAGVGTLIFHLCTKGKVPVFLGSSFAFIPVILTVKSTYNGDLSYAQGGIVVAGAIYVLVSFLIKKIGVDKIKNILPSQVVGPMIIVIGLNLVPVAFNMASSNFLVAGVTLSIALLITWKGTGFLKQLAILIAVIIGYILASTLGLVDNQVLSSTPWLAVPKFTLPKFEIGAIMIIAPVVLAVFMEHVGDITTNGQVVGKNFIEDPGLNKTLLGDGLATLAAGLIGGPANTTYGENTGVLAITKNYNPAILRITAVLAIVLGLVAKIGGFLGTIPPSVMGGISIMLFSMISLIGVKTIKNNNVKFNAANITVMAAILFLGLSSTFIEKQFGFTLGIPLTNSIKLTGLSFAAIIGVILNTVLNRKTA
jgi:uracil permease